MPSDTALYIGPPAGLIDGTALIPDVTVANVHADEAQASDLWDPIDLTKPSTSLPLSQFDGGPAPDVIRSGVLDGGTP